MDECTKQIAVNEKRKIIGKNIYHRNVADVAYVDQPTLAHAQRERQQQE